MNAHIPTEEVPVRWRNEGPPAESPNSAGLQVLPPRAAVQSRRVVRHRMQACIEDRVLFLEIAEEKLMCELKNDAFIRRVAKQIVRAAWRANKDLWRAMQQCTSIHMPLPHIAFKALDHQECVLT